MLGNTPQGGETWGPDAELESAAGPAPPQKPGRLWDPLWAETGECGTEKGGEETDQQDGEGEGSGGGQARGTPQCPGQGGGALAALLPWKPLVHPQSPDSGLSPCGMGPERWKQDPESRRSRGGHFSPGFSATVQRARLAAIYLFIYF